MKPFKLIPSNSFSEKDYRDSLPGGKEEYQKILNKLYETSSESCPGCGYSTGNVKSLQPHLNWWDEKDHNTAEFMLLCEGCHGIKHFDQATERGWCVLVNSIYSQSELIRRNRSSATIKKDLDEHKIVILKKTPKEYLDEILESSQNRNEKTKILFGSKFPWLR